MIWAWRFGVGSGRVVWTREEKFFPPLRAFAGACLSGQSACAATAAAAWGGVCALCACVHWTEEIARLRARFSREDFDRGVVALPKCVVSARTPRQC